MWLIEVHWTQTASCHVLIGLARYSTASEGFCLISREIIYSTSNLLPVVKCHCVFTRPVFMVQLWTSPRTSLGAGSQGFPSLFSGFWVPSSWVSQYSCLSPFSTSLASTDPHGSQHLGISAVEHFGTIFGLFPAPEEARCPAAEPRVACGEREAGAHAHGPGLQLPHSSVSFGPLSVQLLIINNTVYLYQNHYLNWLHDTCCSPNCTPGKMCYKICDFVLCNYPSMGYKALLWCLK